MHSWTVFFVAATLSPIVCADPISDSSQSPTEVAVFGMIHGSHRTSERYGVDVIRDAIRRFQPDVVCCEIPPDRWDRIWSDYSERKAIEDDRVKVFPEYTDVLLPLAVEMGFEVEPCAAWTRDMADRRKVKIDQFLNGAEHTQQAAAYRAAEAAVKAELDVDPITQDDPLVIHSSRYDERTRRELGPYDQYMNDWIGDGGWANINAAHFALIDAALDRHRGQRVLITFGAGHKYWFLDRLREREDVRLVDPVPYLIASEDDMASRCSDEIVALHRFFEDWFTGRLEESAFDRFEGAMAEGFEIVSPSGRTMDRAQITSALRNSRGSRGEGFRIWIEEAQSRQLPDGTVLCTYQEWQEEDGERRGRISSAVLTESGDGPRGWLWEHVHETWIDGGP